MKVGETNSSEHGYVALSSLRGSDLLLALLAIAYVASMPLNETAVLGRSIPSTVGLLTIAVWLCRLLFVPRRPGNIRDAQWTTASLGPLIVLGLMTVLGVLSAFWVADLPNNRRVVMAYLGLLLTTAAVARGLAGIGKTPIVAYVIASTPVALLTMINYSDVLAAAPADARGSTLTLNQNEVGLLLALASAFALVLAMQHHGRGRLIYLGMAVVATTGCLSTGSRTSLISLLAAALVLPFVGAGAGPHKWRRRLVWLFLLAAGALILWEGRMLLPDRLLSTVNRISEMNLTGRQEFWQAALENSSMWLPWGVGTGGGAIWLSTLIGAPMILHNTYLQLAVELGWLGLFLAIAIPIVIWIAARGSQYRPFVLVGLAAWIPPSLTGSLDYTKATWLLAALAITRAAMQPPGPDSRHRRDAHSDTESPRPTIPAVPRADVGGTTAGWSAGGRR